MENIISFIRDLRKEDIPLVGGKGANLGEMVSAGIPVPDGFVVNVNAYREFVNTGRVKDEIIKVLSDTDRSDEKKLQENATKIQKIILAAPMLPKIESEIKNAYRQLSGVEECFVAVRSSATAEDIPEASFAGQQATYLNIKGENELVVNVQKCWASLFTARAIFYREEQKFDHMDVLIAVVVQKMVNSTVSGVMFTSHPITGENKIVIESGYGLGEGVVSGEITPDTYIVDKATLEIEDKIISTQKIGYTKSEGKTKKVEIKLEVQSKQKMTDENIKKLALIGRNIDVHYKQPMDVEWAEEKNELYIVQARPVTTIKKKEGGDKAKVKEDKKADRKILVKGLGASPGFVSGRVRVIHDLSEMSKVKAGDILATVMTSPDMVPIMKKAKAIITDEGGMTCHAAIVSRELGTPCIVGTKNGTKILKDDEDVTVDATKGIVYEGYEEISEQKIVQVASAGSSIIVTATEIKANVDFPEVAERAKALGADGVGLLRAEHMFIEIGEHPIKLINEGRKEELINKIAGGIKGVAEIMYPNPVWYRTLDLKTDEFVHLKGGENEPVEANPMIGWRGIRRSIDEVEVLKCEFAAINKLREEERLINIGVMLPMVQHPSEVKKAKEIALSAGLDPDKMDFGIMVEIPATAIIIDEFVKEKIAFISFGTNDLTQFTLALDRNSSNVAKLYDETHPAVLRLIKRVIEVCKKAGVKTSICGQAGSYPAMVEKLVAMGIDSVSANVDAIQNIRAVAARVEKKLLVDSALKNCESIEKKI